MRAIFREDADKLEPKGTVVGRSNGIVSLVDNERYRQRERT
jgi:hypothetical protein